MMTRNLLESLKGLLQNDSHSAHKKELKSNLIYDEAHEEWAYKSNEDEYNLFYQDYNLALIEVMHCFLWSSIIADKASDDFKINKIYKVEQNGQKEWAINATFKGKASDERWSNDSSIAYFEIEEGMFEGILK